MTGDSFGPGARDAQPPAMITVLCGGVGGSRLLRGLASLLPPTRLTAIINTADDDWFHGLYVSPDPDIVTYALAGEVDDKRGWGLAGDTFRWLESLRRFGHDTWFQIGDRDLATHLHRTRLLREGRTLSHVVADIARAFGVQVRLLPMSDDPVRTRVRIDAGEVSFQEYLVRRRAADAVRDVRFESAEDATPAPGVLGALSTAEAIVIAPSNPIASIGPILAIPGIREAVRGARVPRIAVSPIVGGRSLQPPAGEMMAGLGHAVDVRSVARIYAGLVDTLVIDPADAPLAPEIERIGMRALVVPAIMRDEATRGALARNVLAHTGISI